MFRLVAGIHLSDNCSFYWEKLQRHAPCRILRMSTNGAPTIFSLASGEIYVPIGCRHPVMRYWQPVPAKTTATCSLPHPENEHQWSINSFGGCIFGNQDIALILAFITELLTTLIAKNTIYQRYNPDSKLLDIGCCKVCKNRLLVVENVILIRHY